MTPNPERTLAFTRAEVLRWLAQLGYDGANRPKMPARGRSLIVQACAPMPAAWTVTRTTDVGGQPRYLIVTVR